MKPKNLRLLRQSQQEQEKILGGLPELTPPLRIFGFFWTVMGPLKPWMYATIFFIVVAESIDVSMSYLTKLTIDTVAMAGGTPAPYVEQVFWLVMITLLAGFIQNIFWRASGYAASHYTHFIDGRIELSLFRYLAQHNPGYFYDHFAGALATKVRNVAAGYYEMIDAMHWTVVGAIIYFVGSIVFLWALHPLLVALTILWSVLFMLSFTWLGKRKRQYSSHRANEQSKRTGRLVDSITNMLNVTLFTRRRAEETHLQRYVYQSLDAGRASWRFTEVMNLFTTILTLIMRTVMVLFTVHLWANGQATAGDISLAFMLSYGISASLKNVGKVLNSLYQSLGSIQEGLDTLLVPHGIMDVADAKALKVKKGKIDFQKVTFAYPDRAPVLENFSLSIQPGEKVGLVGRSGAGKTTLMALLLRFYDLQSGKICIDGQSLAEVQQATLRQNVAVVPQESMLFHRSILDNIRYGREDATEEEVHEAARLALAHEFIMVLPDGYNTKVGERGVKLSGGQRQRVAIARAILKNAPILVLDEATASLDSESEVAISEALHNLVHDKTVIAIAHRLSTLREMTRIVVMDGGKIIEDGTHEALLAQGGVYAGLWQTQAGGFLVE